MDVMNVRVHVAAREGPPRMRRDGLEEHRFGVWGQIYQGTALWVALSALLNMRCAQVLDRYIAGSVIIINCNLAAAAAPADEAYQKMAALNKVDVINPDRACDVDRARGAIASAGRATAQAADTQPWLALMIVLYYPLFIF